jgi:hypothetical protein
VISPAALYECCSLSAVEKLRNSYFLACRRRATITFESPSKLSPREERAFSGCRSLVSIGLPSSVQVIGEDCFENCRRHSPTTSRDRNDNDNDDQKDDDHHNVIVDFVKRSFG